MVGGGILCVPELPVVMCPTDSLAGVTSMFAFPAPASGAGSVGAFSEALAGR